MGLASALSTALTGLSASETMIGVAGNNIANSTTNGFKQSQALFTTQFLQTQSLGSAPDASSAGTNPRQIGLGTKVAAITPDFNQGTIQVSSNPADLAIQGDGFFMVQGDQGETEYTRDGSFRLNSQNQLMSNGHRLLGFGVNSNFQIQSTTLQPLAIPLGSTAVAQATQNVFMQGDLSPTAAVATTPQVIESQTLSDASIESPPNLTPSDVNVLAPPSTSTAALAANTGAGSVAAGTYSYEIAFTQADGQESPPSALVGPITTTGTAGVDQAVDLTGLPTIPSGFTGMNIYRTDTTSAGVYSLAGSTTGTTFTDTKSNAQLGAALNTSTLAPGNYSYYVSYYNSVTGEESRPTALIGPTSVNLGGRRIELNNLPSPATTTFDQIRVYRNTSTNSSNFYLDATLNKGTTSYIDGASDASISTGPNVKQVNLDGPSISPGTKLTDLVARDGSTYSQPFQGATQISFTGSKGGNTLDTKTLNVTSTTTVQDLIDFVDQASGIQPSSSDPQNPIPGNPGGSIDLSNSTLKFVSNNGSPNAVSIGLSAFSVTKASGTTPVNLNFTTTQQAVGDGVTASFVAYDSLGVPINVNLTTVLESSNSSGTTYRWFADSGDNSPNSGAGIAIGTGEIVFNGQGNLLSVSNDTVSIARSSSAALPLQFKVDFSQVSGLSATKSTLEASRQDGSAAGTLSSYNIGEDGTISGVFTNGVTRTLGQVQLARFSNNAGLEQKGNNLYAGGVNSGLPIQGNPGSQGIGSIVSGAIEQSNTDIGQNLINLITASTEYRSGAQVITTTQQLLDQLMQIRPGL